jgi:hypothetical protein
MVLVLIPIYLFIYNSASGLWSGFSIFLFIFCSVSGYGSENQAWFHFGSENQTQFYSNYR